MRNMKKASRLTGIPRTTLRGWAGKNKSTTAVAKVVRPELVQDQRGKLAEKWERTVSRALDRADIDEVLDKAPYKDLVIGAGIATEKLELLSGRATSRSESLRIELVSGGSLFELANRTMSGTNARAAIGPGPAKPQD
jgi:hypothetical protein